MKKLLLSVFLCVLQLQAPVIVRNQIWNEIVTEIQTQEKPMLYVQDYLKANETQLKPATVDMKAVTSIEQVIKSNNRLNGKLKRLKEEIVQ